MKRCVKVIEHRGRIILYGDYSGMQPEEFLKGIEQLEFLSREYSRREILHLLNFTDCVMSSEARDRADRMIRKLIYAGCRIRTACFGVKGLQRILANRARNDMYFAKSEGDAIEWLLRNT